MKSYFRVLPLLLIFFLIFAAAAAALMSNVLSSPSAVISRPYQRSYVPRPAVSVVPFKYLPRVQPRNIQVAHSSSDTQRPMFQVFRGSETGQTLGSTFTVYKPGSGGKETQPEKVNIPLRKYSKSVSVEQTLHHFEPTESNPEFEVLELRFFSNNHSTGLLSADVSCNVWLNNRLKTFKNAVVIFTHIRPDSAFLPPVYLNNELVREYSCDIKIRHYEIQDTKKAVDCREESRQQIKTLAPYPF